MLSRSATCWRGHRSFHLIRQPVALLFLPALPKSLLLVVINSRQLTNSTSAFTSGGILSEYEFRSRHSTSQLSSPNAVPLNNVRTTRSHFSLLPCSRCVKAAFRSSSLSARSIWLAPFCAGACDKARTHNRIRTADVSLRLSPLERPRDTVRRSWTIEGRSFVYFTRRRMPKKPTIRGVPWPRSTRAQAAGRLWDWNPARSRPSDHHERLKRWGDEHGATRAERVPFRPRFTEKATRPDFKNSDKASPLLFHFSEQ